MQPESNQSPALRIEYRVVEPIRAIGSRLLAIPVAALALVGLAAWGLLPKPRALENMEEAALTAKAELARRDAPAPWIVMGDSTCLMNFDARVLEAAFGVKAMNLGLWRHLTFDAYASLLRARTEAGHPPNRILLIVHPASLQRSASDPSAHALLNALLRASPRPREGAFAVPTRAADAARDRLINRVLVRPLPTPYAVRHGNTGRLMRELLDTRGFLAAPDSPSTPAHGRPDYALSPALAAALAAFRSAAGDVEMVIALSPTRRSLALRDTEERVAGIGTALAEALRPARMLELPALWEDADFFDTLHLGAPGRERWQARVVEAVGNHR